MRVLSIHNGHDASLCVYNDGEIETYLLSERFTGKKNDSNRSAIDLLLKKIPIFNKKIDLRLQSNFDVDHHIHHASISFYNSGFEEALVIVVDGNGAEIISDRICFAEKETIYFAKYPDIFIPLYKNFSGEHIEQSFIKNTEDQIDSKEIIKYFLQHRSKYEREFSFSIENLKKRLNFELDCTTIFGIGDCYTDAANLIGTSPLECGKAMGLSSYGKPILNFPKLFEKNIVKQFGRFEYPIEPTSKITEENYQLYADYCYEVQRQTQESVCHLIRKAISKHECKNICISGGYGMNIVANYYYLQQFPEINFYFEPLCDDGGQSIGQSMLHYRRETQDKNIYPIQTTSFHGIKYDVSKYSGITSSVKEIAKILSTDKSIAIYTGFAEAGKRALGNRSIFFNALNRDAKKIVNEIKKREWYRPFAAVVLEEDASIYFDMGKIQSSPWMTICFPVRNEYVKIIPGVVHVDNTCRIQTVSSMNGYLYNLLLEVKKLTGYGILLNTSFNLAGSPLVETPQDAFNTLNNSSLDYLWFEESGQLFGS
jgi:carbamoyltransferase